MASAEGTVSILDRSLDVHGGAAAGGLLLLLSLKLPPWESPKNMDLLGKKAVVMKMPFLANKSSKVISQQTSTCKKELSTRVGTVQHPRTIEPLVIQGVIKFVQM